MKHLLEIGDLDRTELEGVLDTAEHFVEVTQREIAKVPALRGRTVATVFYEDSTRTRLSFEGAAKRLSADTLTFSLKASSVSKGESLRDTAKTIEAMGVDAMVVRHPSAGAPHRVASWVDAAVINAGDGWHEHPTQALVDVFTLRSHRGRGLDGLRVGIVGDVKHSRVARSNTLALALLGARVTLIAPPTLLPPSLEGWPVQVSHDLDAVLSELDVVYLLRIQRERISGRGPGELFPSLREYTARWGLTAERAARLAPDALVMHPGPMNRGVEIAHGIADGPASLVTEQVANGVAVRMAVLYRLLGGGGEPAGVPTE
ncbi:MAG: aspartate carbamoyltransferase catalytic subunit [Actinobacteria bacterium]|nr:aspartate carbamoyltransferase catalytic subunit [Actinomycetota bacterium]